MLATRVYIYPSTWPICFFTWRSILWIGYGKFTTKDQVGSEPPVRVWRIMGIPDQPVSLEHYSRV